jgi:hypothetical protein
MGDERAAQELANNSRAHETQLWPGELCATDLLLAAGI